MSFRDQVVQMMMQFQDTICSALSALDGETFREDSWERDGGGGGRSRVLQDSRLFDKAGVNVSVVHGELSEQAIASMGGGQSADPKDRRFFATGMSLVLHPKNPHAPTVHSNYRYFERGDGEQSGNWWFGGGADLTPNYLYENDAQHFHQTYARVCAKHPVADYPRFKQWCDDYFYIKHRDERRGVGGIFFDDLHAPKKETVRAFVQDSGSAFLSSYLPILERRIDQEFTPEQQLWQRIRRGRYVEFNLVYDRGTTFGLKTGGRIESILMSLPLDARWEYDHQVSEQSEEGTLLQVLKSPKNWLKS